MVADTTPSTQRALASSDPKMRLLGFQLAFCIQTVSEGFVTIERIRNFLLLPDKTSSRLLEEGPPDPEHAVVGCVKSLSAKIGAT